MESSRRDLSNDMTEHKPSLKNNQNTYYPRFGFTPKTGMVFPNTGVLFLLGRKKNIVPRERILRQEKMFCRYIKIFFWS